MNVITETTSKLLLWIGAGLFILGLVFFVWKESGVSTSAEIDAAKFGQFGDYVGGLIGSIWALAGVILFYVALTEQRQDIQTNRAVLQTQVDALEQQIEEFQLQREELELTREVFTEQSKTLKLQQVESTFFNSVNLLNNVIQGITYSIDRSPPIDPKNPPAFPQPDRTQHYHGRDCFEYLYDELRKSYNDVRGKYIMTNIRQTYSQGAKFNVPIEHETLIVDQAYDEFFKRYQSDLGHYFRTLYNIIKFVDTSETANQKYYTNLVRSQLSSYEHTLFFYNGRSRFAKEKFYPLIVKYSLLDNLPITELLNKEHIAWFPEQAYQ
ncbi:MAG TPA: putative phage abortive infection protein [Flavobacteriales bacterium]|nr:putative phage abortive infection protein [Flavobacteriales bacterium]